MTSVTEAIIGISQTRSNGKTTSSSSPNTAGHRVAVAAIVNQRMEQTKHLQF